MICHAETEQDPLDRDPEQDGEEAWAEEWAEAEEWAATQQALEDTASALHVKRKFPIS